MHVSSRKVTNRSKLTPIELFTALMQYLKEAGGCVASDHSSAQCHIGQQLDIQDYLKHYNSSSCAPEIMLPPETDVFTYMRISSLGVMDMKTQDR